MNGELLNIQPGELKFAFELKKQISCSLRLVNITSDYVAFKVKTTSPKKYCVRPNTGIIPPQSSAEVTVMMQAQREAPADMQCKDKFLVQSVVVPQGASTKDVSQDSFNKESGKEIHETKLRVVYVAPPQPPSPVAESAEEGIMSPSPSSERFATEAVKEAEARASKPEQMDGASFKDAATGGVTKVANTYAPSQAVAKKAPQGWTFFHLIVIALLAFLIGYFYGSAPSPTPAST